MVTELEAQSWRGGDEAISVSLGASAARWGDRPSCCGWPGTRVRK